MENSVQKVFANQLAPSDILESQVTSEQYQLRYIASNIIQIAGIYLEFPQQEIARAIVYMQRVLLLQPDAETELTNSYSDLFILSACIGLSCKVSGYSPTIQSILVVIKYILDNPQLVVPSTKRTQAEYPPTISSTDVDQYIYAEKRVATILQFKFDVVLPYMLYLPYIQVLQLDDLAQHIWLTINDTVRTCPYIFLIHQPNTIACACIQYSSAKNNIEITSKDIHWWNVFDVATKDLNHALGMMEFGFSYNTQWPT